MHPYVQSIRDNGTLDPTWGLGQKSTEESEVKPQKLQLLLTGIIFHCFINKEAGASVLIHRVGMLSGVRLSRAAF